MITDLKINEEQKKKYYERGYWTHDTIRDVWERQAAAHRDEEYVADDAAFEESGFGIEDVEEDEDDYGAEEGDEESF